MTAHTNRNYYNRAYLPRETSTVVKLPPLPADVWREVADEVRWDGV